MQTPTISLNGATFDPAEALRSVNVDQALDAAGETLREAGEQIRETIHELSAPRSQRRLPLAWPWLIGLAAGLTVIGIGTWWFRRSSSPVIDLDEDLATLDREDLDRATSEGMGTAAGAIDRLASPTNGTPASLAGVGPGH